MKNVVWLLKLTPTLVMMQSNANPPQNTLFSPIRPVADEFDCLKVTFQRFPASWRQSLWSFALNKGSSSISVIQFLMMETLAL